MYRVKMFLMISLVSFSFLSLAEAPPDRVPSSFSKVYAPDDYDEDDSVQIVGVGEFNNSCYSPADTIVKINEESKEVHLMPYAYKRSGYCLQVIVEYQVVIQLGLLKPGRYTVTQGVNRREVGQFKVAKANKSSQEIYAPISQAFFKSDGRSNRVTLAGELPLSCMQIQTVKFSVNQDVILVEPLVEIPPATYGCANKKYQFEITNDLGAIAPGKYLLQVRSMSGRSINNIVVVQ